MIILIVISDFEKINLFLNIAHYLGKLGYPVDFLTPKLHIKHKIKIQGFLVFSKIPKNKKYDKVLFWNGTNTPEKKYYESISDTDCWYFENGYWQGETIQLNRAGINYESDYIQLTIDKLLRFTYSQKDLSQIDYTPIELQNISYLWYFFDRFRLLFTGNFKVLIKSLLIIYRRKRARIRFTNAKTEEQPPEDFIFFPLQVNSDTQLIYNSPYDSMSEVVHLLQQKISNNRRMVIKTHPKEFENYQIPQDERTGIYQKIDLDRVMLDSDFVITVNSSVGFQALEKHKKVLHLGNSFYENFPGVVKCNLLKDNLQNKIQELENLEVDWEQVDKLMYHFRKNIFIEGDWRNPTDDFLYRIIGRIMA